MAKRISGRYATAKDYRQPSAWQVGPMLGPSRPRREPLTGQAPPPSAGAGAAPRAENASGAHGCDSSLPEIDPEQLDDMPRG